MHTLQENRKNSLVKKIVGVFSLFYIVQLIIGSIIVYQVSLKQTTDFLQNISQRVKEDISYNNGAWDTHRYITDPEIPGTFPLYVLSADGFVVDRWKPIHGFLDTSDAKRLLSYTTPQTITSPTNQTWRILSEPIVRNGQTLGIITASSFNPEGKFSDIDATLENAIEAISKKIVIHDNNIEVSKLDVRDITFGVAFQIVDKFNRIVIKNNNTNSIDQIPNYIDASYIGSVANAKPIQQVSDDRTGEAFLLVTNPITDSNNYIIGVVVAGRSIQYVYNLLYVYLLFGLIMGVLLVTLGSIAINNLIQWVTQPTYDPLPTQSPPVSITRVSFLRDESTLLINNESIHIPYATNQYYLCEAVFSSPKKHWEVDELLERFGEEITRENWRKVYDAMVIINKKVFPVLNMKLIINKDRTYQLNPLLADKLH